MYAQLMLWRIPQGRKRTRAPNYPCAADAELDFPEPVDAEPDLLEEVNGGTPFGSGTIRWIGPCAGGVGGKQENTLAGALPLAGVV